MVGCVVTGGLQGLGYAVAHRLASMGHAVTLVARNEARMRQNLATLPGGGHDCVALDVGQLARGAELANYAALTHRLACASVLVNCAGVTTHSLLCHCDPADIAHTLNVNLLAPILLSRLAYRQMVKRRGCIVNVSSVLSLTGATLPGTAVYAALKAGLLGLTQSLAAEFRGKVRVNAVLPGLMDTAMAARVPRGAVAPILLAAVTDAVVALVEGQANAQCLVVDAQGARAL